MPGGVDLGIQSPGPPTKVESRPPVFSTPPLARPPDPNFGPQPAPPITSQEPTGEERRERRNFEQQTPNLNQREPFQFQY